MAKKQLQADVAEATSEDVHDVYGNPRPDHTHTFCVIGSDPQYGHNHYCELEEEGCDDYACFGELKDGTRDIRDIDGEAA